MLNAWRWTQPLIIAASLLVALGVRSARAVTGTTIVSSGKGISLMVSTQWLDGGGYRPVRVVVVPAVPPTVDQTLHIEFHGRQYRYPGEHEIIVAQDITIPAGSTEVVEAVSVPQIVPFQTYIMEAWLNGKYSPTLRQVSAGAAGIMSFTEGLPNIMLVGGTGTAAMTTVGALPGVGVPDSSTLAALFPYNQGQWVAAPPAAATVAGTTVAPQLPSLIAIPYSSLPRRWIELSSLDIICVSLDDLRLLSAKEPERWRAVRQWTAAGGNLFVFNAGARLERADEIAKHLAPGKASGAGQLSGEWIKPDPADFSDRLKNSHSASANQFAALIPPLALPEEPPFLLRRFGVGMVLAAETDDLFKQPAQHWAWMLNSLGSDRWLWYRRHGLSLERKNGEFWNWLVRGVGLAPVMEFRVLITLFVLAIGPLNYFWLRRRGSLHLLVIIVPLAAFAVTFALFGYALAADGLDVRVRARTFTQIDQRDGQAVCWSRISYYAGLAPSGGLVFPDDVAVLPLSANDGESNNMARRQNVIWSTGKQRLVSGWLASRTPTQFVTVRSRSSSAGLRLFPPRGRSGPSVENQLGTRVVRLLMADDNGKHYRAIDIAEGARAQLEAIDPAEEEAAIYEIVSEHQPGPPEGFVPPSISGFTGRRRRFSRGINSLPAASLAAGRLESSLREAVMGSGKRTSWGKPAGFPLAPRSYLAIVERSPEAVFGVDEVHEEDSLHVVVGRW